MLSSRYLHLHEALGLGPMWLKRGAHVRPAAAATAAVPTPKTSRPETAAPETAAPVPPAAPMPPVPMRPPAAAHTPPAAVPADAARRPASPHAATLLDDIRKRARAASPLPTPPQENPLQTAQNLWAARTSAAFPDLPQLQQHAAACTACKLHAERRQALNGHGALPAEVLALSLNPALHDDDEGMLLGGSHGRLLDNMLAAISLDAGQVFRTAWLRCTPRISLRPSPAEQVACAAFLAQEWAWAQAKAVLLLGDGFGDEVQQWLLRQIIGDTPCFILPHPAVLLRQPQLKAQAWPVLQALRATLDQGHQPPQAT